MWADVVSQLAANSLWQLERKKKSIFVGGKKTVLFIYLFLKEEVVLVLDY